jgi:hypothetical protein
MPNAHDGGAALVRNHRFAVDLCRCAKDGGSSSDGGSDGGLATCLPDIER